jgi:hypothetical protein
MYHHLLNEFKKSDRRCGSARMERFFVKEYASDGCSIAGRKDSKSLEAERLRWKIQKQTLALITSGSSGGYGQENLIRAFG